MMCFGRLLQRETLIGQSLAEGGLPTYAPSPRARARQGGAAASVGGWMTCASCLFALSLLLLEIAGLRLVADSLARPRQRVVGDGVRGQALRLHLLQQLHGPLHALGLGPAADQRGVGDDVWLGPVDLH